MADALDSVEAYCGALIASLSNSARTELARRLAAELRKSQQQRIAAQKNTDGSAYAPRKRLRDDRGRLRRKMFTKLRTARFLKASGTAESAVVAFTADVQRIAQVHQLGLRDRVSRRSTAEADYPARELLGISADDYTLIATITAEHLAGKL